MRSILIAVALFCTLMAFVTPSVLGQLPPQTDAFTFVNLTDNWEGQGVRLRGRNPGEGTTTGTVIFPLVLPNQQATDTPPLECQATVVRCKATLVNQITQEEENLNLVWIAPAGRYVVYATFGITQDPMGDPVPFGEFVLDDSSVHYL